MDQSKLIELEKSFWNASNDADTYSRLMADDAISVIEPMGFIDKASAVEAAKQAPGWNEVTFQDAKVIDLTDDCKALIYHGSAVDKVKGEPYNGSIVSIWVNRGGEWKLALTSHQPWKKEQK